MVTRQVRGVLYLARWPETGAEHHPECPSYDLSSSHALVKEREDGTIEMKVGFSLDPGDYPLNSEPVPDGTASLSLSDVLLNLWHQSGLDRWYPRMEGKRHWGLVRHIVTEAALPVLLGDESLAERIFMPEVFRSNHEGHDARQHAALQAVIGRHGLAMLIAPIRGIEPSKFGYRVKFLHMSAVRAYAKSDHGLMADLAGLRDGDRLIGVALVDARGGYIRILDLETIVVTENWLPCHDGKESELLGRLAACGFRLHVRAGMFREGSEIAVAISSRGPSLLVIPDELFAQGWRLEEIIDRKVN